MKGLKEQLEELERLTRELEELPKLPWYWKLRHLLLALGIALYVSKFIG